MPGVDREAPEAPARRELGERCTIWDDSRETSPGRFTVLEKMSGQGFGNVQTRYYLNGWRDSSRPLPAAFRGHLDTADKSLTTGIWQPFIGLMCSHSSVHRLRAVWLETRLDLRPAGEVCLVFRCCCSASNDKGDAALFSREQ